MACNRCKILMVDKKHKFHFVFNGIRKNKFSVNFSDSVLRNTESELLNVNMFFIVIYDKKDIIQLIKLIKIYPLIIIASENSKLLRHLNQLNAFHVVNLNDKYKITSSFHSLLNQILS